MGVHGTGRECPGVNIGVERLRGIDDVGIRCPRARDAGLLIQHRQGEIHHDDAIHPDGPGMNVRSIHRAVARGSRELKRATDCRALNGELRAAAPHRVTGVGRKLIGTRHGVRGKPEYRRWWSYGRRDRRWDGVAGVVRLGLLLPRHFFFCLPDFFLHALAALCAAVSSVLSQRSRTSDPPRAAAK